MKVSQMSDYFESGMVDWPWQTSTTTTITIDYDDASGSAALNGTQEDRFYAGKVWMTLSNFLTEGTLVARNTNPAATQIVLGSYAPLEKGQNYYVFGVRFESSADDANPVSPSVLANGGDNNFLHTLENELVITPANVNYIFDPQTDSLLDWFSWTYRYPYVKISRAYDATVGAWYQRIGKYAYGDANSLYLQLVGNKKKVSPDWDWELSIKFRYYSNTTQTDQQWAMGFTSGNQACHLWEFYRPHRLDPGVQLDFPETSQWKAYYDYSYSDLIPIGTWPNSLSTSPAGMGNNLKVAWSTAMGENTDELDPPTGWVYKNQCWRWTPKDYTSDEFLIRYQPFNEIHTVKWKYTASSYKLECFIDKHDGNGFILVETYMDDPRGDSENPGLTLDNVFKLRKKYPIGHYPLPITPYIRTQYQGTAHYIDIFDIHFSSSCPYDYAGWAASYGLWSDWMGCFSDWGVDYFDSSCADMIYDWSYLYNAEGAWYGLGARRFTVEYFDGYTLFPANWVKPQDIGSHINHIDLGDNVNMGGNRAAETKSLPPINAGGRPHRRTKFNGYVNNGTVRGRVVDNNSNVLLGFQNITGVNQQSFHTLSGSNVEKIIGQFEIDQNSEPTNAADKPPTAVGFSVELFPLTKVSKDGNTVTLSNTWGTIYYKIDDGNYAQYTGPVTISLGDSVMYFYTTDGTHTDSIQSLLLGNIFNYNLSNVLLKRTDSLDPVVLRTAYNDIMYYL